MNYYTGRIIEIQLERYKNASALVRLPSKAMPGPGQYLQANQPGSTEEVVPASLFLSGIKAPAEESGESDVLVWGNLPSHWEAGSPLALRGPLGRGFQLPKGLKRLALIAVGERPDRLLPLIPPALEANAEVTLFTKQAVHDLPLTVEVRPLGEIQEARSWADFLAIDLPAGRLEELPGNLGLDQDFKSELSGELLITADMPCGGLAACGICALKVGRKEILVCEKGPVFSLKDILPKL